MSWSTFDNPAAGPEQVRAYASALEALHAFHDALAGAAPGAAMLDQLADDLREWTARLAPMEVPEPDRLAGRMPTLPVRGHPALPPVVLESVDADRVEGTVTFGTFFLGGGAAAHGGTIMSVFDEVLGVMASRGGRTPARTAYLRTDFRALVPLDTPVRVLGWFDREEGRKRFVRAEMWAGETLRAEADALFVGLREESR